jgi:hypothetical protein
MYLACGCGLMEGMDNDHRMPGQFLPTWAIALLVVVLAFAGISFLLVAAFGG